MSALYISQLIGQYLSLGQQLIVILTSIFASVGAANIPNAGLVTMTLVFTSVGLPTQYIALLVQHGVNKATISNPSKACLLRFLTFDF